MQKIEQKIELETKQETEIFKGKKLLITGGTGSFGNAVLKRFLNTEVEEIRIFSRDEKKQEDMRLELNSQKVKSRRMATHVSTVPGAVLGVVVGTASRIDRAALVGTGGCALGAKTGS